MTALITVGEIPVTSSVLAKLQLLFFPSWVVAWCHPKSSPTLTYCLQKPIAIGTIPYL
jgi:hypothetical protein